MPGGLPVVRRPSCASTRELDAIMTMAKAANFVCGFTPAPLPLAISLRLPAKLSRPLLAKQIIQAHFYISFCLRLCKSRKFIESALSLKAEKLQTSICLPLCRQERTSPATRHFGRPATEYAAMWRVEASRCGCSRSAISAGDLQQGSQHPSGQRCTRGCGRPTSTLCLSQ